MVKGRCGSAKHRKAKYPHRPHPEDHSRGISEQRPNFPSNWSAIPYSEPLTSNPDDRTKKYIFYRISALTSGLREEYIFQRNRKTLDIEILRHWLNGLYDSEEPIDLEEKLKVIYDLADRTDVPKKQSPTWQAQILYAKYKAEGKILPKKNPASPVAYDMPKTGAA